MKRTFIFFVLSLVSNLLFSQLYFERLTPVPQGNSLNSISKVPGSNRIIAVGEGAVVMKSDYFGNFWDVTYDPVNQGNNTTFYFVTFIDPWVGFISGDKGILKTVDGGDTWYEVYQDDPDASGYTDIAFAGENNGFAVGKGTIVLTTGDQGETWTPIETGANFNLYEVEFFDGQTGIITGNSPEYYLKTTGGGSSWIVTPYPDNINGPLQSLYFINETTGFAVTGNENSGGIVFKTNDNGQTWYQVYSNDNMNSCNFDFRNELFGALVVNSFFDAKILTTDNSGEMWWEHPVPGLEGIGYNHICYNGNNIYIAGTYGKFISSCFNNVNNWNRIDNRMFSWDIYKMQFLDENTGFVLTTSTGGVTSSILYKTGSGGQTWSDIGSIPGYGTFFCLNENKIILAYNLMGLNLLITGDGGQTWVEVTIQNSNLEPNVIRFWDENNGIIAGYGNALRTTDGGETWQDAGEIGDIESVSDLYYKSAGEVYATGTTGLFQACIAKSVDGGLTWTSNTFDNFFLPTRILFTDDNTAFVSCGNSTILKSTDSGETWQVTNVMTDNYIDFKDLSFTGSSAGYAVGEGEHETFFKTTDGGDTWEPLDCEYSEALNCVHFFDNTNGLAGGKTGLLLKITGEQQQFNPPQNLTVFQNLISPWNIFQLQWDAPDNTATATLAGYNIFKSGEQIGFLPVPGFTGGSWIDSVDFTQFFTYDTVCYYVSAVYSEPAGESSPTALNCSGLLFTDVDAYETQPQQIAITPNPAQRFVNISFPEKIKENISLSVFDITGKLLNSRIVPSGERMVTFDMDGNLPGIYLIKAVYDNNVDVVKVILKD